ncbi:FGGY-family carbohydrate kinase [Streptomyces albipurpureus]|uniref:FGGY-family carbohydrate kinase n=1 Tax=Streptomyces albipurpureus TaxID=2897419 RepID=A0ABT0UJR3_9ACTN|nr:FGGY-family carbohydrate kinase [Streptomyces sp. CWNU-1]MCM2388591.1 FGGY-family carbohydrate kinase [Streptomyces sp. CWNU-1]
MSPASAPVVVGVDLGSNSARALALDPDGRTLGSATAGYPGSDSWRPGHADPAGWLAGATDAVHRLAAQLPAAAAPVALSFGGQSPTTVATHPTRSTALTCRHPAGATGSPVEQHHAQSALLAQEYGSDAVIWQLYDWVMAELGADRHQSRWPGDPLLTGYGPAAPTGSVVGRASGARGLPSGTPLVAGAQDAYLAFWAGGLDQPGRAMDPGGRTGGLAVAVAAGSPAADHYALPSAVPGLDIVGGPVAAHGLMLEWLSGLTGRKVPELLALADGVPAGARGVSVIPYLEGERAPRWNRALRSEIHGLSASAGPGEITRAALEGAAYGLAHIAMELAAKQAPIHTLVCAGSPALSRLWCSVKASVLGVPVEVPEPVDVAAYGAALAAGAGAGWWPVPGAGRGGDWPRPTMTLIEPEPDPVYEDGLRQFLALGDAGVARVTERQERAARTTSPNTPTDIAA